MKILFLTFYFPPDLSAGSFRSSSLIEALVSSKQKTLEIEVITTFPNRYNSFAENASRYEILSNVKVHRIMMPKHNSDIFGQSNAFLKYLKGVIRQTSGNEYDIIYATSSRLATAILGAFVSKRIKKPLYLDIRDIFVDTIRFVLPLKTGFIFAPLFSLLERYTISSATKVNLVSAGFLPYFKKRYPSKEFETFTNGIDKQFLEMQSKRSVKRKNKELTVLYAGNIGEGQGLHKIIPKLATKFEGKLLFKIVGDGSRVDELISSLKSSGCQNSVFFPPVKRDELIEIYQSADILFLHLNDFDAYKKVLPSKLFEYASTGKPIWAGVSGYAAEFINSHIENSAIFPPCNFEAAVLAFEKLKIVTYPRTKFKNEFYRKKIMKKMAKTLINLSKNN